ncbi:MAG: Holliday junction resolvase RuvX [Gemmatimonadales bacterium]|nr:Holliday junction resolvase RuvX [Gemmatimonadales bacterium]
MSLAPDGSETPPTEGPALSTLPSSGRLLAVDWGERRIGLAVTDETQTLASPLATLTRRVGKRFPMPALQIHLDAQQPVGLLIGLPLDSSGNDGASAIEAREMADLLGRRTGLPLLLWDERMSTARALAAIREQGGSTRGRKEDVDSLAAAIFLQHFLDARRLQR